MNNIITNITNLQNMEAKLLDDLNTLTMNNTYDYVNQGNYDNCGNVLSPSPITNSTTSNCKTKCNNNKLCYGFVFDNHSKTCHLKNSSMWPKTKRASNLNFNLYTKGTIINQTPKITDIINEINNLSTIRILLLKTLNNDYHNLIVDVSNREQEVKDQLNVSKLLEKQITKSKNKYNKLINDKNNKMRLVEINTYYSDKYKDYLLITKIIIIFSAIFVILGIISNKELLSESIIIPIISILVVILILIIFYIYAGITTKNNMNYKQYNTKMTLNSNYKPIQTNKNSNKGLNSLLNYGTCYGKGVVQKG